MKALNITKKANTRKAEHIMKKYTIFYKGASILLLSATLLTGCQNASDNRSTQATQEAMQESAKTTVNPITNTSVQTDTNHLESTSASYSSNTSYEVTEIPDDSFYQQPLLTQLYDLETDSSLEKTIYIPLPSEKEKQGTLHVNFEERQDGLASFSWNEIEGVSEYCVYYSVCNEDLSVLNSFIIGRTTDTNWSASLGIVAANKDFVTFDASEVDLEKDYIKDNYKDKYDTENGPIRISNTTNFYSVIAIFPDGSYIKGDTLFDDHDISPVLPYLIPGDDEFPNYANSKDEFPRTRRVIMCDGTVVDKKIIYGTSKVTTETFVSNASKDGTTAEFTEANVLEIPYQVEGTPFEGVVYLEMKP